MAKSATDARDPEDELFKTVLGFSRLEAQRSTIFHSDERAGSAWEKKAHARWDDVEAGLSQQQ